MLNRIGEALRTTGRARLGFPTILCCAVALLLSCPTATQAQIYYGTITGIVTDATGAVVSGATVTVKNVGTGTVSTATTSDSGQYFVAQLPVGAYEVHIAQKGFKEFVATSVEVHTSSETKVDAQLQLGAANETVSVEASDIQVQTTSGEVGNVIEGTQVRELPLNGENFMGLVTLTPGVSPANSFNERDKGLTGGADFSVNGNPYNYNLFLVDGVNNNDVGSGRTILVYPSVDTISEFKMITNSYGPEYGQASGAIISITTKSGTNQFHGGVFYAGRNDALDANDWFSNFNKTGKAELRRNDWGYNVSGPVIKNKVWFWWNQEWNREVRGQSVSACVPTQAEVNGDFSADASANVAATAAKNSNPGNFTNCSAALPTIPAALRASATQPFTLNPNVIDHNAQLVTGFYPINNRTFGSGGNCLVVGDPCTTPGAGQGGLANWAISANQRPSWSEWNVRGDWDITKTNRFTLRWTQDSWSSPLPNPNLFWGDSIFPNVNSDWSQPSKSVMAKLTTQIGSTLVNDFEFGFGHNAIITTLGGTGATINGVSYTGAGLVKAINAGVPTAWPSSLKSVPAMPGFNAGGWGGLGPYGSGQEMWTIAPYANHEDLYALQDNVSKVWGNHLFKVGAYWSSNAKIENNNGGTDQPSFNPANGGLFTCPTTNPPPGCVSGTPTGNALSNLLVQNQVYTTNENTQNAVARIIWHDFEWYAGDTWKINRKLTLSYGMRWSFLFEPYSETNQQTSWSLSAWSASQATANPGDACNGIIIVPNTDPCGAAKSQLAALGVPLPLSSGTPGPNRALVYNNYHNIAPRVGIAYDPWGDGKTAIRAGFGQFYQREPVGIDEQRSFNAPFVINATDVRTVGSAAALANPSVSPSFAKDARGVVPNSWQWNLSVQRELVRNMTLNVGYVGNSGIHLTSSSEINAVPSADWTTAAFLSGSALNAERPAFNFGTIGQFSRNGHASYNALQVLYKWQFGNYSTLQAAYTYSHSIGNVELDNSSGNPNNQQAVTDNANPHLDRGSTNINRPQIFVMNEVVYLPKLTNKSSLVRATLGGWEVNSILTIASGSSLSVFTSGASGYQSCNATDVVNGTCVMGPASTLNSIQGSGFNNNNRPDRNTAVNCDSGQNGRQILNANAFTLVGYAIGSVGTASRGSCYGPNTRNFDVQLAKNWYFKERFRVKFAMDFFNILNRANFYGTQLEGTNFSGNNLICGPLVTGTGGGPDHYNPCSATNNVVSKVAGAPNASFGQASQVHPGRELQYSLRFYF